MYRTGTVLYILYLQLDLFTSAYPECRRQKFRYIRYGASDIWHQLIAIQWIGALQGAANALRSSTNYLDPKTKRVRVRSGMAVPTPHRKAGLRGCIPADKSGQARSLTIPYSEPYSEERDRLDHGSSS